MPAALTDDAADERRTRVLDAARSCFLAFGFAKTTLDDIARRAGLSRTLLYRAYRDKEAIFAAVFDDWLIARRPAAEDAAGMDGSSARRLAALCEVMVLQPWEELVCTPMGPQFLEICERVAPDSSAAYDAIIFENALRILGDRDVCEVFQLALEGLVADLPSRDVLERRCALLVERFARPIEG